MFLENTNVGLGVAKYVGNRSSSRLPPPIVTNLVRDLGICTTYLGRILKEIWVLASNIRVSGT